ncbi:MAG: hypothetical protein ACSLEN_07380 [Candidatus Malihini olakiniferum]
MNFVWACPSGYVANGYRCVDFTGDWLLTLVTDLIKSLFSSNTASGHRIKRSLNLDDRHLAQATSLVSVCGRYS